MKVTPVISVHIPFGGDNHRDIALGDETSQTVSGVAAIAALMTQLKAVGLQDQVSLMSLNVFGRTLGPSYTDGRTHNPNHQVSFAIGKPFRGGVIGGVAPVGNDYGALAIDSKTGKWVPGGDTATTDTLPALKQTMLAAVGVDPAAIGTSIKRGAVVVNALA